MASIVQYEGAGTTDRRFLSKDERGSIISVSDSSGAMLAINRYDEYGIPSFGALANQRFGYTGQAWLPSAQLWHYKARVYHPVLGRFMQTDPIGYADGLNLYAYVGNDPVNFTDPLGLVIACVTGPGTIGGVVVPGSSVTSCSDFGDLAGAGGAIAGVGPSFNIALEQLGLGSFGGGVAFPGGTPGGRGGGGRDGDRNERKNDACAIAMREQGEISVQLASASLIFGLGITADTGSWTNTSTGTTGQFVTFGFGAGLGAGATFTHQMYNNIQAFTGLSDSVSVGFSIGYGKVAIGIGYSASWNDAGSGGGWTLDIGSPNLPSISAAGASTETKIFNCRPGQGG